MAITRYVGDRFAGLSTDIKPTNVLSGAEFTETDTGRVYVFDGTVWELTISGFTTRADGDFLSWNNATSEWESAPLVLADVSDLSDLALPDLFDVTITSPTDEQVLSYNFSTAKWENVDLSTITSPVSALDDLTDVTITGVIADGEIVVYDTGTSQWINQTLSEAGVAAEIHTHAAADIISGTFANARISQASVTQHEGAIDHDALLNFVANEHIDWTVDQGATDIHAGNISAAAVTQHEGSINHDNLLGFVANEHIDWTINQGITNINVDNITALAVTQHEGAINHDNLLGFVADEHIDWTADQGLTNINDNNISETAVTQHVGAIDHDALLNFVANEHIDWTVTQVADIHVDNISAAAVTQHEGSINHDNLLGFVANEHIDWTATQVADIHVDNISAAAVTQHEAALSIGFTQVTGFTTDSTLTGTGVTGNALGVNINDAGTATTELYSANKISSDFQAISEKGQANGYVGLDGNSKIPSSFLPALAITDVFVVADITARNALVVGTGDGQVQEGDVAVVVDAGADAEVPTGQGASYIYDGTGWQIMGIPDITAAGTDTQVQFNNSGNFGASTNFTFNNTSNLLTVTGNIKVKENVAPTGVADDEAAYFVETTATETFVKVRLGNGTDAIVASYVQPV